MTKKAGNKSPPVERAVADAAVVESAATATKPRRKGTKFTPRTSKLDLAVAEPEKNEWRGGNCF